jgi:hypothetical protein
MAARPELLAPVIRAFAPTIDSGRQAADGGCREMEKFQCAPAYDWNFFNACISGGAQSSRHGRLKGHPEFAVRIPCGAGVVRLSDKARIDMVRSVRAPMPVITNIVVVGAAVCQGARR